VARPSGWNMLWVGIDSGKKGAVGILRPGEHPPDVKPTPLGKNDYLVGSMKAILAELHDEAKVQSWGIRVLIEQQFGKPTDRAGTAFVVGCGFGIWQGLCAGLEIPYDTVGAGAWKAKMNLSSDKAESVAKAQQLYPHLVKVLARKDGGPAEGLLLAEYGRRYR
jgi:hypothetical protein